MAQNTQHNGLSGEENSALDRIVSLALAEDIGASDITSQLTIPESLTATAQFEARERLVMCGGFVPQAVLYRLDPSIAVKVHIQDGQAAMAGTALATVTGNARALMTGERVALNLMQRMAGVATLTSAYVNAVKGTNAVILDTRKTMPGMRLLDKYAVRAGGGKNHRLRLDDMVMIKDNHIALCGGIAQAVQKARKATKLKIEVECDTLSQLQEALDACPDRILLDNMALEDMQKAVMMCGGKVPLEASGGVNLETVKAIAQTGVDYISVGKLTHSAPAADIALNIDFTARS